MKNSITKQNVSVNAIKSTDECDLVFECGFEQTPGLTRLSCHEFRDPLHENP